MSRLLYTLQCIAGVLLLIMLCSPDTHCTTAAITSWRAFAGDDCKADVQFRDRDTEVKTSVIAPCSTDVETRTMTVQYVPGRPERTAYVSPDNLARSCSFQSLFKFCVIVVGLLLLAEVLVRFHPWRVHASSSTF